MNSICIFGASTTWGAWDLEKGGWINRLWLHAAQFPDDRYVEIFNLGISGETAAGLLSRFEAEAKARGADALIFQMGGNDAAFDNDTKIAQMSLEKFRTNLEEIIVRAKRVTSNIIFIGLKNCDETKTMPVSWCNLCYSNAKLQEYNEVMKEGCAQKGVLFLEPPHLDVATDFDDGLHPNALGHEKIFQSVKGFLEEKKWI